MPTPREELLSALSSASADSRRAGQDRWNEHADALRARVDASDRYWLEDRLQDEECELGFAAHPSHISHLLASQGLAYLGDDNALPGPHPHFSLYDVQALDGAQPPRRGHGGNGAATWGFLMSTRTAWFAHADADAPAGEIASALSQMLRELADLGIACGPDDQNGNLSPNRA